MSYYYTYIKNKEDFENEIPYSYNELAYEKDKKYPSKYPCVLGVEDLSDPDGGYAYDVVIIEDLSDFIYKNDNLYKLNTTDFICENGRIYKKC